MRRCRDGELGLGGWLGLLAVLLLLPGVARAYEDAAGVRTARLAYSEGDVTVMRADNTGGDPAQLNMPLTEGMRVVTRENGQAEIEFEDGSLLRMTPASTVLLSRLGAGGDGSFDTEMVLLNGLVYADLRATSKYVYRIVAGADTIAPVANLSVRILLDQPPAEVAVLDGTAHVSRAGGGYSVDVGKGETLRGDEGRVVATSWRRGSSTTPGTTGMRRGSRRRRMRWRRGPRRGTRTRGTRGMGGLTWIRMGRGSTGRREVGGRDRCGSRLRPV